uniref:DDE_3 domain-containing protein n=1 Tax=Anopheles minimus TaxID=112268 RepID=A0A182W8X6_9DIPT
MDNVRFHKCTEIREAIGEEQDRAIYLPPYSPFLNPIENLFSKWKNVVKRTNPQNEADLMEAIANGATTLTADDCEGYIRNMWSYASRCLREPRSLETTQHSSHQIVDEGARVRRFFARKSFVSLPPHDCDRLTSVGAKDFVPRP